MNFIGLLAALTAFFSIWFGHVAVRKIESVSPTIWLPTLIFLALGLIVEILSLSMVNRLWSVAFGILGITLLFEALELRRQQKRVKKGHAPANPNNPRHAKILAEHSSATILDLLKRDPIGHVISSDESTHLLSTF
jgi:hypothetical protein